MSATNSSPQQQQRPRREPQPIIYSLCIPRVFKNITEKRIRAIFYSLKLGFVERVDMVAKTSPKGDDFWRVFIHFSNWNERNPSAMQIQEKLDSGDRVKIVYDDPWFWLISKSSAPRPEQYERRSNRPAPFIDFGHTPPEPSVAQADFPPTVRHPRPMPVMPQSPTYTPTDRGTPRSPSPDPTMPRRELTCAEGDSNYQEHMDKYHSTRYA